MELTVNLARLNVIGDILGAAAIDLAADGESSTENLEDGTLARLTVCASVSFHILAPAH